MYKFEYQEGLNNLIIHADSKGSMITITAANHGDYFHSEVVLFAVPKEDLLKLLEFVTKIVGETKEDA